ncbi:MAG: branched-chain amino acid transaminase [Pseudomonadota bacterium]
MSAICYFNGAFVPTSDARIGIDSGLAGRGLGVFEGIRAYWNEADEALTVFRLREHMERLERSARVLFITLPHDVDTLCELTVELLRRNDFRTDVHLRPIAYKSSEEITSKILVLSEQADGFAINASPLGRYLKGDDGVTCMVSSWRRTADNAMPARAKITGNYVNSALAKTEAVMNGFDEAIFLTDAGMVAECSAQNLFLVRDGVLVTPSTTETILEGITRETIIELARKELGAEVVERPVARSELYLAEEAFLTGSGSEVKPIVGVDHRAIGGGVPGPTTKRLVALYEAVARGTSRAHPEWRTPVLLDDRAKTPQAASAGA